MRKIIWIGFAVVFLLSLDFWAWDDAAETGWLGLPGWIWYLVGLQLVIAGLAWFDGFLARDDDQ